MPSTELDSARENRLCSDCVGDLYLKSLIQANGKRDFCSYCDEEGPTLSIDEVANLFESAFDEHYERTSTEPEDWEYSLVSDRESNYEWERKGEQAKWAILNAGNVSEDVAEAIRTVIEDRHFDFDAAAMGEECPFAEESHYTEKDPGHGEFLILWDYFEKGLKTQSRFFSRSAKLTLDQIFAGISDLHTVGRAPVVVTVGPGTTITEFYRARVFAGQDEELKTALHEPWKHLGPPPAHAAAAGRMNARGISVFYGAVDIDTALSEVRAPVGSKVALARFQIVRPLRLLDLSAVKSVAVVGSIFDPETIVKLQRANFLEVLSHLISRAVMPHEEASEYLPTQAVADYLASEAGLDGMIFPSVQAGHQSSNVVLFHQAARVQEVELPPGTEVEVRLENGDSDGFYPDYRVWEKVPSSAHAAFHSPTSSDWPNMLPLWNHTSDARPPTLAIDLDTIQVHHVKAVTFQTEPHGVNRRRFEQPS